MSIARDNLFKTYRYIILMLLLFISLVFVLWRGILLPWSYYLITIIVGIVFASLLLKKNRWQFSVFAVVFAVLLWNLFGIVTNFSTTPFYDSYNELIFSNYLFEGGHFELSLMMLRLGVYRGVIDPSSYPLFSILTVSIASITGIDVFHTTFLMTILNGLAALMFIYIFSKVLLKKLLPSSSINTLFLVLLIVVTSPDMVYNSMHFYHRHYSLILCFMTLYLLLKYSCSYIPQKPFAALTMFMLLILPLSYSYYPAVYIVFFFFTALTYIHRTLFSGSHGYVTLKNSLTLFLLILISGFLWYFTITFPNTFVNTFIGYVENLLSPQSKIVEFDRVVNEAWTAIPRSLTPELFLPLLQLRLMLLLLPTLIGFLALVYQFFKEKGRISREALFTLLCTVAFAPLITIDIYTGYWLSLEVRYYALPVIVFYAAAVYAVILANKRKIIRITVLASMALLVTLAFMSPYSHVYYPRQLYDSSLTFKEIGQPNPAYLNIKSFLEEHPLRNESYILSDFQQLLFVVLPLEKYNFVWSLFYFFGESRSYLITFLDLNPTLGYHASIALEMLAGLSSRLPIEYNKILDSYPYTIYYKGDYE